MHSYSHNYDQIYANVGAFSKDLYENYRNIYMDLTDVKIHIFTISVAAVIIAQKYKTVYPICEQKGLLYFD